jgi:WhiB family redox-sensing transcriptional regulator
MKTQKATGIPTRAQARRRARAVREVDRLTAAPATQLVTEDQARALAGSVEPGWQTSAACASADPDAWFPLKGSVAVPQVTRICARCPVARSCLAMSLLHHETGVWAGTTAVHRQDAYRALGEGVAVDAVLDQTLARRACSPRYPNQQPGGSEEPGSRWAA